MNAKCNGKLFVAENLTVSVKLLWKFENVLKGTRNILLLNITCTEISFDIKFFDFAFRIQFASTLHFRTQETKHHCVHTLNNFIWLREIGTGTRESPQINLFFFDRRPEFDQFFTFFSFDQGGRMHFIIWTDNSEPNSEPSSILLFSFLMSTRNV